MNRLLIALNVLLVLAVAFLFYKVYGSDETEVKDEPASPLAAQPEKPVSKPASIASPPTGKIAYVDIDRLNEESLEIMDLVTETKRRKSNIEASVESLSMQYQKKVEEFQMSQKAGIAPQSDLEAKAREIQRLEQEAQNKQLQMDNLSMDINDKNLSFQKTVKDFLSKWNNGRYDFILSYSDAVPSMLLGNSSLEVTDEIIAQLNAEYKAKKKKK
jgi:outer membrane protein